MVADPESAVNYRWLVKAEDSQLPPFPDWLKRQLVRREWTQADFGRRVERSSGVVSNWMSGRRRPDPESVVRIADVFGYKPDIVLTIVGYRPVDEEVDPDSNRERIVALVQAIDWTDDRTGPIELMLRGYRDQDRRSKAKADTSEQ